MDIGAWLRELGLAGYEQAFREHHIDARSLPHLTADDLKELGVTAVGHRRLLLQAIAVLRDEGAPSGLAEAVTPAPAAPLRPEAERRQLTVMFCDLVDSTALARRLDPEDLHEVVRAFQGCAAQVLAAHEGHIAKYLGDGFLAFFGYPHAHEDDAERSVRAGLELARALAALRPRPDVALQARIGIATGPVVVGGILGEGADQEEVVGNTPALAARLQTFAAPGSVVISPGTRRLLGRTFELVDLGLQDLKGFPEPLPVWRVEREAGIESRFEALRGQTLVPLVGREHELDLVLERWARAKQGEGQVVLLEGEPGIGKSRLLSAIRERLQSEPYTPLSHFCSPHHQNSALHPVIALLERAAGFERADPPEQKLAKLEALLARGTTRLDTAVPLIADLLGLDPGERYPPIRLTGERRAQRTVETLLEQVEGLAARQPVLALYEDMHWSDPTSLEVLDLLIERVRSLPVLVLITFRPEFTRRWTGHAHVTSLSLARLTRQHGAAIVDRIALGKALPGEVVDEILARSDGNPLSIEELTKAVLESGTLEDAGDHYAIVGALPQLAIPATLQDSLMARLDHLAPVREVAQLAAVIGREFSHQLLAAIAPVGEDELGRALDRLLDAQLIFRSSGALDGRYRFKHALVQEAAYESLLRRRRQILHGKIAQAIRELSPEPAADEAALVAYHYARSAQPAEAFPFALLAGDQAMRLHARQEATTHYQQALALARALPPSPQAQRQQIDAMLKLAAAGMSREETLRDQAHLEAARALAVALDDAPRQAQVLYWLGRLAYVRGEFQLAIDYAGQSLAVADRLGDEALSAAPVNLMGRACYLTAQYVRAGELLARSVEQMQRLGDLMEEATAAGFAGIALAATGQFERGIAFADLGLRLARELQNPVVEAAAQNYRAVGFCHQGAWADAIAACEAARRAAEQVEDRFRVYLVQYYEGQAYTAAGDPEHGRKLLEESIALAAQFGTTNLLAMGKALLAGCLLTLRERRRVPALCREAIELAQATHDRLAEGMAQRTLADALADGDSDALGEAESALLAAIGVQRELSMRPELARSYLSYARLLRLRADDRAAAEYRAQAIAMFEEMGMAWDLARAERL